MDANRFDDRIRSLTRDVSRRGLLRSLAAALGLATARVPGELSAKKRKKKPLRLNEFGCINVGKPCRGNDVLCCSGICQGRRPRKGKKDRSRCVAHDTGICQAGQVAGGFCGGTADSPCTTSTGMSGVCNTTTGNAGYCSFSSSLFCAGCTTDATCQVTTANPRAACIRCAGCSHGTACVTTSFGG